MTVARRAPLRLNALTVALMTRAMMDGPCTFAELGEACGLARHTIFQYIRALRSVKAVYIADWEQDNLGRFVLPAFSIGEGKDKKRPPRFAGTPEHSRQRKAREKQNAMNHMMAGGLPQ